MRRREFIQLFGAAAAWPLHVQAQQLKAHRVGLLFVSGLLSEMDGPDPVNRLARAFVHGLRDLGYVEGQNLVLERRSAEGAGVKRAAEIGADLIRNGIDVLVLTSTPVVKEIMSVSNAVPLVMAVSVDPVGSGVVASYARPGGNVTGLEIQAAPEIEGKRLQLLKDAIPNAARVAFLGMKSAWDGLNGQAVRQAATKLGMLLDLAEHTSTGYSEALARTARQRPDALFVANQTASYTYRQHIIDFARDHRIPATYPWRDFVDDGGFMSYGTQVSELFRRAAGYVDKILRGEKPANLPIEQPTKFELVINLKTAKVLGLTVPPLLLARADEVIE